MAFLPYPPATTTDVIAVLKQDAGIAHEIIHGNVTADVDTESGLVPSFAKVVKTLTDEVNAATGVDTTLRANLASVSSTVAVGGVEARRVAAGAIFLSPSLCIALGGFKSAVETALSTYGTVHLTAGSYSSNAEVDIPSGKSVVVGGGAVINATAGSSVFRIQGSGVSITGTGKIRGASSASVDPYTFAIATGVSAADCTVDGLTIEDFGNPVVFTDSARCTVQNCTIKGYRSMGIWFNSTITNGYTTTTQDASAINNILSTTYGSYTAGVQAKGIFMSGLRPLVAGNQLDGGAALLSTGYGAGEQQGQRDGIWLNFCQDFLVYGNVSRNSVDDCITCYRGSRGLIDSNVLYDSYITVGVLLIGDSTNYCEDITVSNNKCYQNGYGGIAVLYGRNITIDNNECKNNGATGYLGANGVAGFGILAEISQGVNIVDNETRANKRWGIYSKTVNLGGGTIANNTGIVISGGIHENQPYNIIVQGDTNTKHAIVNISNVECYGGSTQNLFLDNVSAANIKGGKYGSATGAFVTGVQYGIYAQSVLQLNIDSPTIEYTTNSAIVAKPAASIPSGEKIEVSICGAIVRRVGDGIANANSAAFEVNADRLSLRGVAVDYADKRGILFTPRTTDATFNVNGFDGYRIGGFNVNYGIAVELSSALSTAHIRNVSVVCDQHGPNAPRCQYAVKTPNGCTNVLAMNIDAIRASSGVSIGTATNLKQVNVITSYA
jgi:parallel beta-helix repeat protein